LSKTKHNSVTVLYFIYFKVTTCFGPYVGHHQVTTEFEET